MAGETSLAPTISAVYKLHLILKYLRKRRIAWVSLIAVMLCTTMVIVVISVMGGWLDMFKQSFHGLSGDLIVQSDSLSGTPNLNTEVSVLNKVNATNVLALQNAQDTNKLLVAILEQQTVLSKQTRDSATNITNADISRRTNSVGLGQQLTSGIGQSLNTYQLP